MLIIDSLEQFQAPWPAAAITLGDFDGFHRGHRFLIETCTRQARQAGLPAVLITYDPSPKKVLRQQEIDHQIYSRQEKIDLLSQMGLDAVIFIPFNIELSHMPAIDFLQKVLLQKLRASYIVIGYDHHFGHNHEGNFQFLQKHHQELGFQVRKVRAVRVLHKTVSSRYIKKLLSEGKIRRANYFLQFPFFISGKVIAGFRRGRSLGFPTANLQIAPEKILPANGVYSGLAKVADTYYRAVVNIGHNPTFGNREISVEAHLLDFDQDLYGQNISVYFFQFLRSEKKFSSGEELKSQIKQDILQAQKTRFPGHFRKLAGR